MMLSQVINFLKKNKKIMYYLSFFTIIYFVLGDSVFASEPSKTSGAEAALTVVEAILKGVSAILAILTYLVTLFLDPSWINGSIFGLTEKFRTIWIMVSNVVYFIFAVLLVWIAFMNIIGKEGDKYQLKQALPKFVVGVLIVPFSWFIVQMVLSISAILTVSAISLPYDTFSDYETRVNEIKIKNNCEINLGALTGSGETLTCTGSTSTFKDVFDGGGDANSTIFATISTYTFGILKIDSLDELTMSDISSVVKTVGDVVIKVVIDVLFILIYAILMIALGLVLMIRGIYLWLYIMFSPLFGLMYFFDKNGSGEGFFEKFNFKEFFALAMVPVYSMLALSFGLLFMYVVGEGMTNGTEAVKVSSNENGTESDFIFGEEGGKKSFNLKIKGSIGGGTASDVSDVGSLFAGAGKKGLGIVGTLIIQFFGIVVLWGTIMAAMRSSSITKAIVEPIHQFGTQVGSIMAKAPQNLPIFGGQSMKSMGNVAQKVGGHIDSKNLDRANKFVSKNMTFLDPDTMNGITRAGQIKTSLKSINNIGPELAKEWKTFLGTVGTVEKGGSVQEYQNVLKEFAKITKVPEEELKNLNTTTGYFEAVKAIESKMDGMNPNYGAFKGTVSENSSMKREDVNAGMKEMGTNSGTPIQSNLNKDVKKRYIGNDIGLTIGSVELKGKTNANGSIESFMPSDYNNLAEYIVGLNKDQYTKFMEDFDIKLSDDAEKQILSYIDTKGNFVGAGIPNENDRIDSIDKLFKKEETDNTENS